MDMNSWLQPIGIAFTILGIGLALMVQGKALCIDGSVRDRRNTRARLGRRALFMGLIFAELSVGWLVVSAIVAALRTFTPEMPWLLLVASEAGVAFLAAAAIVGIAYVVAFRKP